MTTENKHIILRIIGVVVAIVIALLSIFVISKPLTSVDFYKKTVDSIDEKKATVMGITTAAATVSTVLAAVPDDATTPIAEQIMEVSSYLLIVVCVLVLEKSLLTVMGFLASYIFFPLTCALFAAFAIFRKRFLITLTVKFLIFSIVIASIVPLSFKLSDFVYEINTKATDTVAELTLEFGQEEVDTEESVEETEEVEGEDGGNWFQNIIDKVTTKVENVVEDVKENFELLKEKAKQLLNKFIDVIAIFIISYCAIPILVILFVIWILKLLFNISVPIPSVQYKRAEKYKSLSVEEKEDDLTTV